MEVNIINCVTAAKCYSYIRFSTPEQAKGDSLRRQLKASEDYAKEHGLELDKELKDEGLSAYKGEHRTKGALGRFLIRVQNGEVPKGSVLLVESLDRLSREEILSALQQFLDIIRAGIRIVTLMDKMEYTEETANNNIGQLIMSLVIMSRAHEESLTKAKRLKAAWSGKREKINQRKLTARAPAWLKLSDDRTYFEPIPERIEIVNKIFKSKLNGKGSDTIAIELNKQSSWKLKNGWRKSYIDKILRNSAVIGEYQPHELVIEDGRRVRKPIGEFIKDYFPVIVSPVVFYSVQKHFEENRKKAGNSGGRNGTISNLFGHIAKCGYCGAPMTYINKGSGSKGGQYLVCDKARRGMGCDYRSIRYEEFETLILTYCRNLNPIDILPGHEEKESIIRSLQGQLLISQNYLKGLINKVNNLTDSIASTNDKGVRKTLEEKLAQIQVEQNKYYEEIELLQQDIQQASNANEKMEHQIESIKELLTYLREETGEELIEVRRRLREELRKIIDRIEVCPVGGRAWTEKQVKDAIIECQKNPALVSIIEEVKVELWNRIENKDLRVYNVFFKSGSWQELKPKTPYKVSWEFDQKTEKVFTNYQEEDGEIITLEAANIFSYINVRNNLI